MFLNLSLNRISFFTSLNPTLSSPTKYNKITMYGGSTVSQLWGRNRNIPEDEINAYNILTYKPEWDADTYCLSKFINNLNAGNIIGILNPITQWNIYRKASDENISKELATLPADTLDYKDFTATSNKSYNYYISASNNNELSNLVTVTNVRPDYYGWFLIDEQNGISYKFDANLESGSLNYEEDITWYNNNTKYPVASKGKLNAMTIQIKAILFDPINLNSPYNYEQSNQILADLNEFISSSRPKILKDRRGRIWRGETFGNNEQQLSDSIQEQIVVTSFTFKETAEV